MRDCLFIRHQQDRSIFNLLIDGGPTEIVGQLHRYAKPFRSLLEELRERNESIDLAIITHVDDDHIGGILETNDYIDI